MDSNAESVPSLEIGGMLVAEISPADVPCTDHPKRGVPLAYRKFGIPLLFWLPNDLVA